MAKWFLTEHEVLVNGEPEQRRGRKLKEADRVEIGGIGMFHIIRG